MEKTCICRFILVCQAAFLIAGCAGPHTAFIKDPGTAEQLGIHSIKAIVIYDSWSGNTQAVAQVLAEEMNCPAVKVDDAAEYTFKDYDLLVVGSPVHGGRPTGKISAFLSELEPPRASAVFVTFGAPLFGPASASICLDYMEKKLSNTSIGRFRCNGFHRIFRTYPDHPDEKDKADAAEFAGSLMILCAQE